MAVVVRRYKLVGPSNADLTRYVGADAAQSVLFPVEVIDISINDSVAGAPAGLDEYMAMSGWVYDPAAVPGGPLASTAPTQIDIGDAAAIGSSSTAARSDHQHALPTPSVPVNVTKAGALTGSSTIPAREDHKHDVTTGAPSSTGTANAEGVSQALARQDHIHRTLVAAQDEGAAVASRPTFNFVGAGVVAVDNAGQDRIDVTISGGGPAAVNITQATATASTTVTATSDTLINAMSIVAPATGSYMVHLTGSATLPNSSYNLIYSLYVNGVQVAASVRTHSLVNTGAMAMHAYVTGVTAGQVIEVRARNDAAAKTSTILARTLTIMQVA
jgi:hypothetical protein